MTSPPWRAGTSGTGSGTSYSVSAPSGLTLDDVVFVAILYDSNTLNTPAPPSDGTWHQVFLTADTASAQYGLWWHPAGSSEPASWTFTNTNSCNIEWVCGAWSGADTSSPVNDHSNGSVAAGSSSITLTAVSPTVADCTLAAFVFQNTASGSITADSSMTSRVAATPTYGHINIADEALTSTGSTGTRTFSNSSNTSRWNWAMVAIAPAPANVTVSAPAAIMGSLTTGSPTVAWKATNVSFITGALNTGTVTALWKAPTPSAITGALTMGTPGLRWRAVAPGAITGALYMPVPAVGIFQRIAAPAAILGALAIGTPSLYWKAVAPSAITGALTMPAPAVPWKLSAPGAITGALDMPAPSLRWRAVSPAIITGSLTMGTATVLLRLAVPAAYTNALAMGTPGLKWIVPAPSAITGALYMPVPTIPTPTVRIVAPAIILGHLKMGVPFLPGSPYLPATDSQTVTDALSGRYGPVVLTWGFERRTITNLRLADVSEGFTAATIDFDNSRASVRTAQFIVDPTLSTVDAIADHIAVICNLLIHYPGNPAFQLPIQCGLFALNVPAIAYTSGAEITWTIQATDLSIHLVQSTTTDIYTVAAGTNYVSAINSILSPFGFQAASITPTAATLAVAQTWPAGTPWLTIVNKLLADINYYPLWFDRTGVPTSRLMVDNSLRVPDVTYTDNEWLISDIKETTDTTRFANQVLARVNHAGAAPLSSVATNADPSSPTSTVSLGRTITQVIDTTAPDQTTLDGIAQQALKVAAGAYRTVAINTQVDPRRDAHEVYALSDTVAGYQATAFLAETWKLDIDKPDMQHTAIAVLPVNIS